MKTVIDLVTAIKTYVDGKIPVITGKADKVTGATSGNFAGLDSNGNLTDSGSKASDFLTSHQDISGKMDKANPTGTGKFVVGSNVSATGTTSQAMGDHATASKLCSHAEGKYTEASGIGAHAEGYGNGNSQKIIASGGGAHAEGYAYNSHLTASGTGAHAEGRETTASGKYSHAGGNNTIAAYESQTTIGQFNSNKSTTYFEVGNGTSTSARSNAFEVYSDGSLSTDNGTTKTKLPSIISATLAANATQVVISNVPNTGTNLIEFYTSVPGLDYSAISVSGTTVTLTYEAQSTATTVYAVITEVTS